MSKLVFCLKSQSKRKVQLRRQPQDFYRLKTECFVYSFRVETKTRYEMVVKTFDKFFSVADSPVVVLFTDGLV